jgi:hypothetical protein
MAQPTRNAPFSGGRTKSEFGDSLVNVLFRRRQPTEKTEHPDFLRSNFFLGGTIGE